MEQLPHFAYPSVEDNWDLHAVVRSCSYDFSAAMWNTFCSSAEATASPSVFPSTDDASSPYSMSDELEEVYKPFYPEFNLVSENMVGVPPSPDDVHKPREKVSMAPAEARDSGARIKKRKQQEKKVVHQVTTSDAVGSDMWAWRKYGQKPIKGSPYPRSYYRCSSSKGCLARKQVERSRLDPAKFIVTYSEEHNHACPTRRSTLAGSCRSKGSAALIMAANKDEDCSSPDSVVVLSTVTPFVEGGDEDVVEEEVEERDGNEFGGIVEEEDDEELVAGRDLVFENFFMDEICDDYHL